MIAIKIFFVSSMNLTSLMNHIFQRCVNHVHGIICRHFFKRSPRSNIIGHHWRTSCCVHENPNQADKNYNFDHFSIFQCDWLVNRLFKVRKHINLTQLYWILINSLETYYHCNNFLHKYKTQTMYTWFIFNWIRITIDFFKMKNSSC